ncbi:hypothetical protein GCM10009716_11640 [Streptomyces sodiiphilus]|uniref:Uncharacterized protein n=1 Tax=Streptomyces sodiiphilus TaxID=226217 RepID=A0ABN2NUD1_9ACTN
MTVPEENRPKTGKASEAGPDPAAPHTERDRRAARSDRPEGLSDLGHELMDEMEAADIDREDLTGR